MTNVIQFPTEERKFEKDLSDYVQRKMEGSTESNKKAVIEKCLEHHRDIYFDERINCEFFGSKEEKKEIERKIKETTSALIRINEKLLYKLINCEIQLASR